jgi:L-ascorbate metabolism protein UlaG (beta-lactamase superfamily)
MIIANSHLKIMQSFINVPQVHQAALKDPKMIGGPFIDYDASATGAIKQLMDKTTREQERMLKLAEAIKTLDEVLTSETDGSSLEPIYQRVPDILKGYIELVYDLNNNPSVRFIEGLFYLSPFYSRSSQSVALSLINKDSRPFVFSTPRLKSDSLLHLDISFDDEALDELFKMKNEPQPLGYIKEALNVGDESEELFSRFFTEEGHAAEQSYSGDGVRVRYFGHACLLIESNRVSVMTDPLISYKCGGAVPRLTYADLPESIDYAVITHNHQDHCMFETLLQLRSKIKNIIVPKNNGGFLTDPSMKLALRSIGFKNVAEIDEMETVPIEGGAITGLPFLGEHADLNVRSKIAYLINLQEKKIVCAADSNNIEPVMYKRLHEFTGDIDLLFLGMECDGAPLSWVYGSLLTKPLARRLDQSRRLNGSDYEKAISIVDNLNPKQVYVYAMGQEPWLTHVTSIQYTEESKPIIESNKLVEECRKRGIVSERLFGCKEIELGPN